MKASSKYVFAAALASVALGSVANGAVISAFTFDPPSATFFPSSGTSGTPSSAPTSTFVLYASVTGSSVGPILADVGTGSAYGVHAATNTVFSAPVGNGTTASLSANRWATGDYWEFRVPTTGFEDILLSFDQTSSGTGPKSFVLSYSTDGTNFSAFSSYSYSTVGFSATATATAAQFAFDLSAITALDNAAGATFRIVNTDTTATATAGTNRIDTVVVSGTAVVPEPAALSLVSVAGAALMRRRSK